MEVAVTSTGPTLDDQVEARFGRCRYFLVVDTDSLQWEALENPNLALGGGAGIQSAQMMTEKGVSHVLTGNCGPNTFRVFGQAGVAVVVGVTGPVRQAVERFKAGQFTNEQRGPRISPFGRLFRFIAWWFGFTGLYTAFAVCPFCGQQGCPVGLASAGTVGAFLALCVQDWKRLFIFMKQKLTKKNKQRQL